MPRKVVVQVVDQHHEKNEDTLWETLERLEQAGYRKSITSWGKYKDNGYPDLYVVLIKEEWTE